MSISSAVADGKPADKKTKVKQKKAAQQPAKKQSVKKKVAVDTDKVVKEAKIIPIAAGKKDEPEDQQEPKGEVTGLVAFDNFRLPAVEIDGKKSLSFSMPQLDSALTTAHKAVTENDYARAVLVCHQLKNGKYQELGSKGAADYYGDKFGIHFKVAMRYQKVIWFLREVIGLSRDDQLKKVYETLILNRVDQLATYVVAGAITPEQAKEEMTFCVQNSGKSNEEWTMYMKERFGKEYAAAKRTAGGSDGLIPVKGFKVEEIDFEMIVQAQQLASKLQEKPGIPVGDAMVMASQHFVSHYGEGMVNVAATITAMEKAHGMVLIPLPLPGSKAIPNISAVKVYSKDGTLIFMDSKRAAAKYFGVTTAEVIEVAIDPRPYLHNLGYSDKPKDLVNTLPKTVDELTDEEAMAKVSALLKDVGMSRTDWTDKAIGKSIRQQIVMLLELKGKKLEGDPVLIDGKTADAKKAAKIEKATKKAVADRAKEEASAVDLADAAKKAQKLATKQGKPPQA
jgi:hypothetical protein